MLALLVEALQETLIMVFSSGFIAILFGFPLGLFLCVSQKNHLFEYPTFSKILYTIVNSASSLPFVALMILMIPLTNMITSVQSNRFMAILPLTVAAIPLFAQMISDTFNRLPKELMQVGFLCGAQPIKIVTKILIPEAFPNIVQSIHQLFVRLIAYSTVAGILGAGGLGQFLLEYGYKDFHLSSIFAVISVLLVLIQITQSLFDFLIYDKIKPFNNY